MFILDCHVGPKTLLTMIIVYWMPELARNKTLTGANLVRSGSFAEG